MKAPYFKFEEDTEEEEGENLRPLTSYEKEVRDVIREQFEYNPNPLGYNSVIYMAATFLSLAREVLNNESVADEEDETFDDCPKLKEWAERIK